MDLKTDIKYLQEKLENTHKDLYRNVKKEIFTKHLLKSTEVEPAFFKIALQEALALVKDSHTEVQGFKQEFLPFAFKTLQKNTYIIATSPHTKEHLYKKVEEINGYPLEKILEKISLLSSKESKEVLSKDLDYLLESNKVLRYYGFSNLKKVEIATNKLPFTVEFKGDETINMRNPLDWQRKKFKYIGNPTYRFRKEGGNLIFQYNACNNKGFTKKNLKEFKKHLLDEINKSANIVIDLRLNSGGDTEIMRDLIEKLPENKKIYVASGQRTFSSAMHHLLYLKRNKGAILIGENTGQKPNRFGDCKIIILPNSKIKIKCSYKYFELLPGQDLDTIEPDIKIPITIENYIKDTDPLEIWIKTKLLRD